MPLITWSYNNYLTEKDTFSEIQKWMGYVWYQLKYYSTYTLNITSSDFLIKPSSGTGSEATDVAANAAQIVQAVRAHIADVDNLNYDTDLTNQPAHYDAALPLQVAFRTAEVGYATMITTQAKTLADALNQFFVSVKGESLREWWNDTANNPSGLMTVNSSGQYEWDEDFIEFWETTRSEILCRALLTYKNTGGTWAQIGDIKFLNTAGQMYVKTTSSSGSFALANISFVTTSAVTASAIPSVTTLDATSATKEVRVDRGTPTYVGATSITFTPTNTDDGDLLYLFGK